MDMGVHNIETFSFSRDDVAKCLLRDILPSGMKAMWNKARKKATHTEQTLAEHDGGFFERATLTSQGNHHVLSFSAQLDSGEPCEIMSISLTQNTNGTVDVGFDLRGIGFHPPQDQEQAERVLREAGNVLRYVPKGLKFDGICREFRNWAGLEPDIVARQSLHPRLLEMIKEERLDPAIPSENPLG